MKQPKIKVICLECGKKFQTTKAIPDCPKCGGADVDVREYEPEATVVDERVTRVK